MRNFPNCYRYVKSMGIRTKDLKPWHIAVILGDAKFTVEQLNLMGAEKIPTTEWGCLLPAMEALLIKLRRPKRKTHSKFEPLTQEQQIRMQKIHEQLAPPA